VREEDTLKRRKTLHKQTDSNPNYYSSSDLLTMEIGLPNYTRNIVRQFYDCVSDKTPLNNLQILDFGAGTGALAQIWFDNYSIKPDCVEIDSELTEILRKKGFKVFSDLNEISEKYNFVYTSNVLEHIKDDLQVLQLLAHKMKENSKLAIYVPAFPILFSGLDYKVGHFRRYTKKELAQKVTDAGFSVIQINFCDSIGFFGTLVLKLLRIDTGKALGSEKFQRFYDSLLHPLSMFIDKIGMQNILGKNLLLIAVKKPSL
jgi:2-polyprenyl-3-methyl-5-hydroxy-6-metoxy-1,4-benzoquinol methylase